MTVDIAPVISEFRSTEPTAPTCGGTMVGCVVCSVAEVIVRMGGTKPNLTTLGKSMGARHRAEDPRIRHGLCPEAWCGRCAYLELKARGIAVGYSKLTPAQMRAHASAGRPMVVPVLYSRIPYVSSRSYSATVPARGRSDSYTGGHTMAIFGRTSSDYICADPDFGSPARPVMPPHSLIELTVLEAANAAWAAHNNAVVYCLMSPPGTTPPPPPPSGVQLQTQWGAFLGYRGDYKVIANGTNVRRSPFIRSDNIARKAAAGTLFHCSQSTRAGTNVGGSTLWHGNAAGTEWLHSSVIKPV